ncbi:hypothetical protein KIW84_058201 [Lathyrus oleraceus]|uniref:SKP1 component POZ domain-containing protein n=1 Tax=Pisum sativum TaxID=3888 RepID=A0A9D4X5G9_PEA|nr:hypothetical protein KIW84_058201 [Pisum sativum]
MSKFISFEEGWETLHKGITKLHKSLEGLEPSFTSEEFINLYTYLSIPQNNNDMFFFLDVYIFKNLTMYEMCTQKPQPSQSRNFARELYDKYRETCEEYIISNIDRKLAGEMIDQTFLINTLDFYIKFYKCSTNDEAKGGKRKRIPDVLSNKVNLMSSDGAVFETDDSVALMSKRFENITETISVGDYLDVIYVQKVNSKMLTIIIEYCKKHGNYYELNGSYNELMEADAKFVEVDPQTLLDLTTSACYMKIESLEKLTSSKVDELIKGKTPEEIAQIFGDDSNSKLFEKLHEENVQRVKALEF